MRAEPFGRMDRTATAAYHFRPFGVPEIEAYFGGRLAADLENPVARLPSWISPSPNWSSYSEATSPGE